MDEYQNKADYAIENDSSDENATYNEKQDDIKTYLSWHAPGRPYQSHSLEYYTNSFLITLAIEIILFLFSQYLLMALVISLAFLVFALAVVPPHKLYYRVSSEGIRIEDHYFIWDELYDFYFLKSHGQDVLHIRTKAYLPGELTIILGDVPTQQVKTVLLSFLPFREYVKPSFVDKAGSWLEKNFPLEKPIS
ncbi:MAG TPA: hypothetical protein VNW29_00165 [Candidatus Sulfotelmatobacter sp.]|jgi:hypothetical protein|nr:hypothetical protein [Candidatus Sulfotelmatobacter sp.]